MKDAKDTPVLFLIFNRPGMTAQIFDTIAKAKPKRLFIAADGPRRDNGDDVEKCRATREVVNRIDWECKVETLYRDHNLGCRDAIASAITWFFEHVEQGIIIEDDILFSETFFSFCTEMLERYADDKRIMMISGNNYQNGIRRGEATYYFSRIPNIWGWATWRRAWNLFDLEMGNVADFREENVIDDIFVDRNIALNWKLAFALARNKKVSSWDYPWIFTCLTQNGLSIVPNENLVSNIGFGNDSTHTKDADSIFANADRFDLGRIVHPQSICCHENADLYEYILKKIFPQKNKMGFKYRHRRMRLARRFKREIEQAYETDY